MRTSAQLVLLNGAWHGAWCWTPTIAGLSARGFAAVAVEPLGFGGLRGSSPAKRRARPFDAAAFATEPSAAADVTRDEVVTALLDDVAELGADTPVVLVAHSLAGLIAIDAVQRAPELFSRLIFLAAVAPVGGRSLDEYNALPEMADSLLPHNFVGDPGALRALRCDFDGPPERAVARATFYHDVPDDVAERATDLLVSDVPLGISANAVEVTDERLGSVPRTWLLCTQDRAVMPAAQRRYIADLDAYLPSRRTDVVELDSSHSPFLSMPGVLCDTIAKTFVPA